ncbi:MAG TPA: ThuA domain-containing protein [Bryobacteraceae bacterium]|nr:ThuA domain-containing protein [Bryobacteraceae bacterium]
MQTTALITKFFPGAVWLALACFSAVMLGAQSEPLVLEGKRGPGHGKQIVFVVGDQEYRSEESMPALARILAERDGFRCTVLFSINPQTGEIDPATTGNIPGLEALRRADLMVLFTRWLALPDDQMKEIIDYTNSGRPIVALRTATHAFNFEKHPESAYAKYSYHNKEFDGGYGRQVLGETWIRHYGAHQKESTRGIIVPGMENHPILRGVKDIWGESDVYAVTTLSGDSQPLVMGQVLTGMEPSSPPDPAKKLVPIAWVKTYTGESGKPDRIFTTTMGHAMDFRNEGFRRMVVNACFWAMGMKTSLNHNVALVRAYNPNPIGEGKFKTGLKPSESSVGHHASALRNPARAAAAISHIVSSRVNSSSATLTTVTATVKLPVTASRASGTVLANSSPAPASRTARMALLTRARSARAPRYWTSGIIKNAGVIIASHPAHAPGMPSTK